MGGKMMVEAAGPADIPLLCNHHRKMFQEMWAHKGLEIDETRARALESAYREKLDKAMPEGICRAWVIRTEGQTIASGAMSLVNLVPVPGDLNRLAGCDALDYQG